MIGPVDARGHLEAEVDDLAGAGRDLLVVERDEDVLRVAAVDPVAVAVEHVDVDEVRVRVDRAVRRRCPPERPMTRSPGLRDQLDPDLVGVDRPLAERVAEAERPDDDLDQVRLARLERRDLGPERAEQLAVDRAPVAEARRCRRGPSCP